MPVDPRDLFPSPLPPPPPHWRPLPTSWDHRPGDFIPWAACGSCGATFATDDPAAVRVNPDDDVRPEWRCVTCP